MGGGDDKAEEAQEEAQEQLRKQQALEKQQRTQLSQQRLDILKRKSRAPGGGLLPQDLDDTLG